MFQCLTHHDFHSAPHKQLAFLRFGLPQILQRHVCQQGGAEANGYRARTDPESTATGRALVGPITHETARLQSQQAVIISQSVVVPPTSEDAGFADDFRDH